MDQTLNTAPPRNAPSTRSRVFQAGGFLIGIALLAWAVRLSLTPENIGVWKRLRGTSPGDAALLIGLTVLSLALNGVIFWLTLLPLRRIPAFETIGVNIIGTFLTLLPLKLSLVARTIIHRGRHGITWKQLASWGLAFIVLTGGTMLIVGAGVTAGARWSQHQPALALGTIALLMLCAAALHFLGVLVRGNVWYEKWFHFSDTIFRSPIAVTGHIALRACDMALFGARFAVAAKITGVSLGAAQSFIVGSTYLFLNAVAPAGSLGFTEAGTAGAAKVLGMAQGQIVSLALIITACQGGIAGILALPCWLWLKPKTPAPKAAPA